MAIQSNKITLDGHKYTLDGRDRVAAQLVNENANTFSKKNIFTSGIQITHAVPTPASTVTLTAADNGNRTNIITSISSAADSYVLPTAALAGEWYRFIWGGSAADADNLIFKASAAAGLTFTGGLLDVDEDDATDTTDVNVIYPGAAHETLTLTNPTGFDITFIATTTTNYCVTGWVASTDTSAAFGDI
jgi:hypothetical protein